MQAELRAHGYKAQDYTSAALTRMAEGYAAHLEQAAADVATFPGCARRVAKASARVDRSEVCAELSKFAQRAKA